MDVVVCFSLIIGCCYKFFENLVFVKNGIIKDLVFNFMGVMVKEYNYGLGERVIFCWLLSNIIIIVYSKF